MRRIIRIFLASSIVEFANERMAIENFIRNISDKFEENYDVKIQPLLCENFDDAYSKIRKQEEYNEKIRNSDLCFFIFFTKAGEYTREEFEVAHKKFEETGKPKIYTYFKVIKDETAEQSLYDFMNELDKTFGHYYGTFEHIDTVKLRILLNLKLQEMDFLEIKVDGDACVVDGKKTLSLENVSEFANNSIFQEMKAELYEVEERYFNLKAKYEKDECSQSEEHEYIEIASKRQNLIDAIEEIQKNIFNMSLRMCQDEAKGEITLRQKEAYRLFEAGDLEGANNILDFAEIENDYLRDIAIMEANIKKRSEVFIRETKTKIDILKTMTTRLTRFAEIEALYDKILPVALKYDIETDAIIDFVWFLYEQNKHQKAYENLKKVENLLFDSSEGGQLFNVYSLLGIICSDFASRKSEAEKYHKRAIEIAEKLAKINSQRFNSALVGSYNNAGYFYNNNGCFEKAEKCYKNAISICEKLAEKNLEEFDYELSEIYCSIGVLYTRQELSEKAEEYYKKSIVLKEKLARINPERFSSSLADLYNNIGVCYDKQGFYNKAEKYYKTSMQIYEELAQTNPERFNPGLADAFQNMGVFYDEQGSKNDAEEYYGRSLVLKEKLAQINPEVFDFSLADIYYNVGVFYYGQDSLEKAEEYYIKAIAIKENLAQTNLARFGSDLANSYNSIGLIYNELGFPERVEEYYKKAIGIREKLTQINLRKFGSDLADNYNNIGVFYEEQGLYEKVEVYLKKAIAIREKLAQINPEEFNPALAISYLNYSHFMQDDTYFRKAFALAKTMPEDLFYEKIIDMLF